MKIAVCAPAGRIEPIVEPRIKALAAITFPEVEIVFHPQCFMADGHFAGSDAVRAAAFLEFANDPAFDAIWFARGGYGSNRILHAVMPKLGSAARHKTYLGYSDIGFLLGALYAARIGRPTHGPVTSEINRKDDQGHCVMRALAWLVNGDKASLEPSLDGKRPVAAFNLSILNALIGTPWLPDLTDHVLMVEEVSEELYRVDRMLFQMSNATQLKGLAGVRLGRITDVKPNTPEFAETPEQMITRWCGEMGVPYLGPADIAHDAANKVVPFGLV
jgi:muramoyltetrapeptide carboxypeptidase